MEEQELKLEYRLTLGGPGPCLHQYIAIGAAGAVQLVIREYDDGECSAGLEIHYREAPDYMRGKAPSQERCWLLESPCWHDGSSLWAEDYWLPIWRHHKSNHREVLLRLSHEYGRRLAKLSKEG